MTENILTKFATYHKNNPILWREFIRTAEQLKARNSTNASARDWIRFSSQRNFINNKGEIYRIPNAYTPLYIRLLEFIRPDLSGIFAKAKSKYDFLTNSEWRTIAGIPEPEAFKTTLF